MNWVPPFPFFSRKIDSDHYAEDVIRICQKLRPGWEKHAVKIKVFTEGQIHKVLLLYNEKDETMDESLVFRIFPDNLIDYIDGDGNKVVCNLQIASKSGNGPRLLATFANGIVSAYVKGTTMKNLDFRDIKIVRQITDHIARLHTVDLKDITLHDLFGKPTSWTPEFRFLRELFEMLDRVPKTCKDPEKKTILQKYFNIDDLREDAIFVKGFIERSQMPVGFCHSDLHKNNMIIDRESEKITLIDFDLCGLNFQCCDISAFMAGDSMADENSIYKDDVPSGMPEDQLKTWIEYYLEAKYKHSGQVGKKVTPLAVRKFLIECQMVDILSALPSCICQINYFEHCTTYDAFRCAVNNRKKYLESRDRLEMLLQEYSGISER